MPPRATTPRAPAKISAQTATPDLVLKGPPDSDKRAQLAQLFETVSVCAKCVLGGQRTQAVFGVGNYDADLMFIGEAPGANEDRMGIPFVGNAGKLLTQELEKNNIPRDDVFIANILKCRPPENRDPLPGEIEQCSPYLLQQIDIIKPKLLCGLGRFACGLLMKQQIPIMKLRGTWSQYHGLPLFICLHPSAILHNPNNRELFIQDIAQLAKTYHEKRQ
jgi:uracil-DNA glycosylase